MKPQSEFDFLALASTLRAHECLVEIDELQGMLCAIQSVKQDGEGFAIWVQELFPEQQDLPDTLLSPLQEAYQFNRERLDDADFGFDLWLPNLNSPLDQRVVAIGRWCQGYLFGLGAAGFKHDADLSEDAEEFLRDASEIARIGLSGEDYDAEADSDFVELVEFVRMGAVLVYEELVPEKPPTKH